MDITPRNYRNMQWAMLPSNRIDTVVFSPISNMISDEPSVIATETFDIAENLSSPDQYYHRIVNIYDHVLYGVREYAKGYTGVVISSGTRNVYVEQATRGRVSAKLSFNGNSYSVGRGGSTYDDYPLSGEMLNNTNLAQWVKDNSTEQLNSPTWSYDMDSLTYKLNPFIRNFIPFELTVLPSENDIRTKWWNSAPGRMGTRFDAWSESTDANAADPVYQYSTDSYMSTDDPIGISGTIYIRDVTLNFSVNVRKIDDHNFQISWSFPTRLTYLAASRQYGLFGGEYDVDNYALLDVISSIQIQLWSYPFSTEVVEKSYGLDSRGFLTEQVKGKYPFKIDAGEALTTDTYALQTNWMQGLSWSLLDEFKNGKYVVKLDVTAKWAIENNIGIKGTAHKIVQQDGTYISRDGEVCKFYVYNITKRFKGSQFIYTLDLMEV